MGNEKKFGRYCILFLRNLGLVLVLLLMLAAVFTLSQHFIKPAPGFTLLPGQCIKTHHDIQVCHQAVYFIEDQLIYEVTVRDRHSYAVWRLPKGAKWYNPSFSVEAGDFIVYFTPND